MRSIGLAEVRSKLEDLLAELRDGGDPVAITDLDDTLAILMPAAGSGRPLNEESGTAPESIQALDRTTQQRTLALMVAEAALRRSQSRLSDAIESSSEGFILFDADERLVLCNSSYRDQHAELAEYLTPRALLKDLLRATAAKVMVAGAQAGGPDDIDGRAESLLARYRNPGEPFEIQLSEHRWLLVSVRRTREGGVVGISSDITHRRKIDETLRVRDAWLRAILDNSPIQIALKDTDCRVMAISANVSDYNRMTPEECIGLTSTDALPSEIGAKYLAADREVLATGLPKQQEIVEDREGTVSYFLSSKFPLRDDDGRIIGICSLTSDITEAKRSEQLLRHVQKMEAIDQLTGGVAHDFNNLLGIIQGNAELLEERIQSNRELIAPILRAADRGAVLTQSFLAFSRRQLLQPRSVDLANRVEGVMELLKRALGVTIEVETHYAIGLWNAAADPGQVEDALLNLAINARDAMPEGGKLTIDCTNIRLDKAAAAALPEMRSGDYVVLSVADTGVGMSAETRERAIEPFFTTKAFGRGSGLGLSMAYGFAKQSGGHIALESEEGRGTIVRIYLPRDDGAARLPQRDDPEELALGQGQLVLVIEDHPDMRRTAIRMLEELNYRVIEAPSAVAARSVLAENRDVDLLLTDIVLPGGLSGPAFAREAIAQAPSLAVVFMSGYSAEDAGLDSHWENGQVLLQKPFKKSELARTLLEAL